MKHELDKFKNSFWLSPFFDNFNKDFRHIEYWSEEDNKCQLQVEIPGVEKEDIKINLEKDHVEISASKKIKTKNGETSRSYHNYFSIPSNLDAESIEAEYKNGVLTLTAAKTKEEPKKQIEIK